MSFDYYLGDESSSDSISTEGGDPLFLFSFASEHAVEYGLQIDWDNDDEYNSDNEADYLLRFDITRGRDRIISAPGRGFEPYRVGRAVFTLDNSTGRFNPWNTSGALYGNLDPGKKMRFKTAVYNSTDANFNDTYSVFTGYVVDVQPRGWNKTANIICEDGFSILSGQPIDQKVLWELPYGISNYINDIIDRVGYPYSGDVSTNDPTESPSTDYYFPRFTWIDNESALDVLQDIADATIGSIAAEGDGTFAYHSIYDSDTSITTFTDELVLSEPYLPNPWEYERDTVEIYSIKANAIKAVDIYFTTTDNPITVPAGDTVEYWAKYRYDGNTLIGGISSTTDNFVEFTANTSNDGTGADASTNITLTYTDYLKSIKLVYANSSTDTVYITTTYNRSENYNLYLDIDDTYMSYGSTSTAWDVKKFTLSDNIFFALHYDAFPASGSISYTYAEELQSRIDTLANLLVDYLSTNQVHPTLQMQGRPDYQWLLELENKVTYQSDTLNINSDYRICGLSHKSLGNPQDVITTIHLYPVIPSTT